MAVNVGAISSSVTQVLIFSHYLRSASKDPDLEQTYLRLLKETSPHEKAITRDLGRYALIHSLCLALFLLILEVRTFPHHAFFNNGQGIGQENLFNVLKAYSMYADLL